MIWQANGKHTCCAAPKGSKNALLSVTVCLGVMSGYFGKLLINFPTYLSKVNRRERMFRPRLEMLILVILIWNWKIDYFECIKMKMSF